MLSACSGGGAGDSSASGGSGRSSTGGDTETLPTSGGGEDLTLPTVPGGASDTVNISTTTSTTTTTTTTTTIPTTTTTVPPPVIPSDVLFDTGQATLKPEATPYLQDLADQINQRHPGARLHFVGHTDSRGSVEANNTRFAGHGFDRGRLTAEGAGESRLLVADTDGSGIFSDAAGRQNRRVEIRIR